LLQIVFVSQQKPHADKRHHSYPRNDSEQTNRPYVSRRSKAFFIKYMNTHKHQLVSSSYGVNEIHFNSMSAFHFRDFCFQVFFMVYLLSILFAYFFLNKRSMVSCTVLVSKQKQQTYNICHFYQRSVLLSEQTCYIEKKENVSL